MTKFKEFLMTALKRTGILSTEYSQFLLSKFACTIDSKIIRALEIVRVKKLINNAVLLNKFSSSLDL